MSSRGQKVLLPPELAPWKVSIVKLTLRCFASKCMALGAIRWPWRRCNSSPSLPRTGGELRLYWTWPLKPLIYPRNMVILHEFPSLCYSGIRFSHLLSTWQVGWSCIKGTFFLILHIMGISLTIDTFCSSYRNKIDRQHEPLVIRQQPQLSIGLLMITFSTVEQFHVVSFDLICHYNWFYNLEKQNKSYGSFQLVMGVAQERWRVFVREHPNLKWRMI